MILINNIIMLKYQFSIFNLLYSFTKLLCCLRFFEKLCPPFPLATKNKKSVFSGFATAFIDDLLGLQIGLGGSPSILYVLKSNVQEMLNQRFMM